MAVDPLPHARLLSVDRRDAIDRLRPCLDRSRDDGVSNLGATGPRDRSRQLRLDGTKEGGGLFLMAVRDVAIGRPIDPAETHAGEKPTLRLVTCGSVDDGKSTLVGRLL